MQEITIDFWAPRKCLLEPIPEIFEAAQLLDAAVEAHFLNDNERANTLIVQADMPIIKQWTESLWGGLVSSIHRYRKIDSLPPLLSKGERIKARMPSLKIQSELIERDGHHCRYCGIPLIRQQIRSAIQKAFPSALSWGTANAKQHAAFQCMWLTYEHVIPHSRGGDNSFENMVISCQPCNCGKMQYTLEELGLIDPRTNPIKQSSWSGLEHFIQKP